MKSAQGLKHTRMQSLSNVYNDNQRLASDRIKTNHSAISIRKNVEFGYISNSNLSNDANSGAQLNKSMINLPHN